MFKKEGQPENFKDVETVIGESIKVKGNFSGQGNIIVDGTLEGSLKTKGSVFIGDKAKISANLESQEMIVNGEVNGNIIVDGYLAIGSTAKISGDIACVQVSIERGAVINGKFQMSKKVANISGKETEETEK